MIVYNINDQIYGRQCFPIINIVSKLYSKSNADWKIETMLKILKRK